VIIGQVKQLQHAQTLLPCTRRGQGLQAVCRCIQVPEANHSKCKNQTSHHLNPSINSRKRSYTNTSVHKATALDGRPDNTVRHPYSCYDLWVC